MGIDFTAGNMSHFFQVAKKQMEVQLPALSWHKKSQRETHQEVAKGDGCHSLPEINWTLSTFWVWTIFVRNKRFRFVCQSTQEVRCLPRFLGKCGEHCPEPKKKTNGFPPDQGRNVRERPAGFVKANTTAAYPPEDLMRLFIRGTNGNARNVVGVPCFEFLAFLRMRARKTAS